MPKKRIKPNNPRPVKEYTVDDLEAGTAPQPGNCRPGSIEQQLDMCESGPLRGDDLLHNHGIAARTNPHPTLNDKQMEINYRVDMSEENREGAEETGDDHSFGLQGSDQADTDSGMPGEMTGKVVHLDPTKRGYRKRAA